MKYERRHIEEIKKIAVELRKELSGQSLNIRAKLSSIANLAEVCLANQSSKQEYNCSCSTVKRIGVGKFCPDCGGRNSRR